METQIQVSGNEPHKLANDIQSACDWMEKVYASGRYVRIAVHRSWSKHNPTITGKIAKPSAMRWYLKRELYRLAMKGATIDLQVSRPRIDLNSPDLLYKIDEANFDQTLKKVFLFGPERTELSVKRLEHYTGTNVEDFQRYVLLTNYQMHMDAFRAMFPDAKGSAVPCMPAMASEGGIEMVDRQADSPRAVQMPALHQVTPNNDGVTIINIGVGPSNAKNLTDHLAVLRPDAMVMVGHCAGVRNHQEIGDFVLASGYMRGDHVLDDALPRSVPIAPSFLLNRYLAKTLEEHGLPYRYGAVHTTADRNWELAVTRSMVDLKASRSIAVDMESATVAANGFRFRIPSATLLCISDKPLHGKPKLPGAAQEFYADTKAQHLEVAYSAIRMARSEYPGGLPNSDLRAMDEPLLGGSDA